MKKQIFIVAAVIISSHVLAQDSSGKVLDEIILTANKFEQKQNQTGKTVTVIGKEQLEKSSGKSVAQVLNEQAGISITGAYNTAGSVQTVLMRGSSSGRTLILLDGIPVNDPSMINNEFDLNFISINDVERIEICKGAQSTLYGSDAIAGVINIITTKKDVSKPFQVKAAAGFGNRNTTRNHMQAFGRSGKLLYSARFARLSTDGFSSAHDKTGSNDFDNDGYDGNSINASLQYEVLAGLSVMGFIRHSRYKADIDAGVFADDNDYTIRNRSLYSGAGVHYNKGIVNLVANYQYGELSRKYKNDSLDKPGFTKFESNIYGSRTQYAELYGNIRATKYLTVLAGFDYRWSNMNQQYFSLSSFGPYSSNFSDTSVHQSSWYASLFFTAVNDRLHLEIGGRTNKHSRYGTNSTYTFNPSFGITEHWRVFGSIATGFKAPSIFQVYDAFSGNPELKPEKSFGYEAGVQQQQEKLTARAVFFHRTIKNGIDYNYTTFHYFNFVKQRVSGLEAELRVQPVTHLSVVANYTLLTGKEETQSRKNFKDTTYNYLLRRPKNSFYLSLGYQFSPGFFMSVSGKSVGSRYDVGGFMVADIPLDSYVLLSAYAEYKWKVVKLFADLQNITNKKFFDIYGYNAIPFMVYGGVSIQL